MVFATPATNPLVCGRLSCLRHFRYSRRFREKNAGFAAHLLAVFLESAETPLIVQINFLPFGL